MPENTTTSTFDARRRALDTYTVKELTFGETGSATVLTTDSTGFGVSAATAAFLNVGREFELETVNFSLITGIRVDGQWVMRKSDQDLDEEHRALVERINRDRAERLEKNRENWQKRQDALPDWIRTRIEGFHQTGGEGFALDGWGYELTICELAVLYLASGLEDDDTIDSFAHQHGTSGNQQDFAKALARHHDEDLSGTVSALSPITGDADYSKVVGA